MLHTWPIVSDEICILPIVNAGVQLGRRPRHSYSSQLLQIAVSAAKGLTGLDNLLTCRAVGDRPLWILKMEQKVRIQYAILNPRFG